MASDFWRSSHWKSLTTRERLRASHVEDRRLGLSEDNIQAVKCCALNYLSEVAKASQQLIRQRVVGTASVFFRRFYLVQDFCKHDPRDVGIACLYLACKAEEAQVAAKVIFQIMKNTPPSRCGRPNWDVASLLDLEMALLEVLDYNLVVFSPYRDLVIYLKDSRMKPLADFAWAALNDSFRTDACLLFPPFLIAIAALNVAAAACKYDLSGWLGELNVDLNQLAEATEELMQSYMQFNETISDDELTRLLEITAT